MVDVRKVMQRSAFDSAAKELLYQELLQMSDHLQVLIFEVSFNFDEPGPELGIQMDQLQTHIDGVKAAAADYDKELNG